MLPLADDGLDVAQAEAHLLELADPADAHERLAAVEPEAPLGARRGREQAELLVQVDRADRLARFPREVADLHQIAALARVVERTHARPLAIRMNSAGLRFAMRAVDALEQGESVMVGHRKP